MLDGIYIMTLYDLIACLSPKRAGIRGTVHSTMAVGTASYHGTVRSREYFVGSKHWKMGYGRRDAPAHLYEDRQQRSGFPVSLFQMRFWAL